MHPVLHESDFNDRDVLVKSLIDLQEFYWGSMNPFHLLYHECLEVYGNTPSFDQWFGFISMVQDEKDLMLKRVVENFTASHLRVAQEVLCNDVAVWSDKAPDAMRSLVDWWAECRYKDFSDHLLPKLTAGHAWGWSEKLIAWGAVDSVGEACRPLILDAIAKGLVKPSVATELLNGLEWQRQVGAE